jgi:hypothetical protein
MRGKVELVELGGRVVEGNARIGNADDAIGKGPREFQMMQGHDGGDAILLADRAQEAEHRLGGRGIETRDRFVSKNHGRLLRERARNADALLLSAGKLVDSAQRLSASARGVLYAT